MRRTLTAAALLLAATACSSHDPATDTATPPAAAGGAPAAQPASSGAEPRTEGGVRAAATEEFDSYAASDYGAAWDVWSTAGKKAISRANYQKLFQLCPEIAQGVRFQIQKITMDSDHEAHVRVSRLIVLQTYQFVYEAGHWRFVPLPEAMNDYHTKTVQQITAERRATGGCAK